MTTPSDNPVPSPHSLQLVLDSLTRWNAERSALSSLPALNKSQKSRLSDLNSSVDSYQVFLEDLGSLPTGAWITRANTPPEGDSAFDPDDVKGPSQLMSKNAQRKMLADMNSAM